jgi:hypothetical protein
LSNSEQDLTLVEDPDLNKLPMKIADCGFALSAIFKQMIEKAQEEGHNTVWFSSPIFDDFKTSDIFIFCTTNSARTAQVIDCLKKTELLCQENLGNINTDVFPRGQL